MDSRRAVELVQDSQLGLFLYIQGHNMNRFVAKEPNDSLRDNWSDLILVCLQYLQYLGSKHLLAHFGGKREDKEHQPLQYLSPVHRQHLAHNNHHLA